jgi:hypothetical protein
MVINNLQIGNLLQVTMEASIAQTNTKRPSSYMLYLMIIINFVKLTHISHHKLVSPRFKVRNHKSKSQNTSINMQLERPSYHRLSQNGCKSGAGLHLKLL